MYKVNEIFCSPQGEGIRAGTLNVFVRFAHCNLKCSLETHGFNCDTDFTGGRPFNLEDLVTRIREIGQKCKSVIFTGGEPALQLNLPLVQALQAEGYFVAIETNGTVSLEGLNLDWITVSPKSAAHTLKVKTCSELKYVISDQMALPVPSVQSDYKLLSPAFEGLNVNTLALKWCITLIKEDPTWRLSVQNHKFWKQR